MIDWTHWHNEPFLIGGLIFLGWLYAVLTGPLRGKLSALSSFASHGGAGTNPGDCSSGTTGQPSAPNSDLPAPGSQLPASISYPYGHAVKFYAGLLCFYLGVGSPLDQFAERYLLSAHMLQHQILIYPAAVLFLLGLPDWVVRPVTARPSLRPLLKVLTHPVVCGSVYTIVISGWHVPFLYDWALQNRVVHVFEHFMMFGAALFYWWPLLSPSREFPPVSYASQMVYLVAVGISMTPVFAYITFADDILYPTYEYAPRVLDMSAASDQLLAGAMMKLVGMAVAMIAFGVSFYRWYQAGEAPGKKIGRTGVRPA